MIGRMRMIRMKRRVMMRMMEDLGKGSCKEEKEKVEHDNGNV